jgi:hypothetical protein
MNNTDYIVWYADINKLDLKDPRARKWWIQQVLIHGRLEDVKELNFDEVKKLLPSLHLDYKIKSLWEDYFNKKI